MLLKSVEKLLRTADYAGDHSRATEVLLREGYDPAYGAAAAANDSAADSGSSGAANPGRQSVAGRPRDRRSGWPERGDAVRARRGKASCGGSEEIKQCLEGERWRRIDAAGVCCSTEILCDLIRIYRGKATTMKVFRTGVILILLTVVLVVRAARSPARRHANRAGDCRGDEFRRVLFLGQNRAGFERAQPVSREPIAALV